MVPIGVLAHDDRVDDDDARPDEPERRQHVDGNVEARQQGDGARDEIGMPRPTQGNPSRSSSNGARTRDASAKPARPLRSISESWLLMTWRRSARPCARSIPAGRRPRAARSPRRRSRSRSGPLSRRPRPSSSDTTSKRASWRSVSSKPSTTVATSPRCRRSRPPATTEPGSSNSFPRYACPFVRSRISPRSVRRPARQVQRRAAHGLGRLVQGQAVPPQVVFRYLDRGVVGRRVHGVHLRDLGNRGEIVPHPLGDLPSPDTATSTACDRSPSPEWSASPSGPETSTWRRRCS